MIQSINHILRQIVTLMLFMVAYYVQAEICVDNITDSNPSTPAVDNSRLKLKDISMTDSNFVHFEHNSLLFPAGHRYFDTLYNCIYSLNADESTGLRMLHIGGSHVQAGVFTGRMRNNIQSFYPFLPAGEGIIFPFSVMGTNSPKGYKFTSTGKWDKCKNTEKNINYNLGLSGAAIATNDISATLTFSNSQPFESVLLFGENLRDTAFAFPMLIAEGDTFYSPRSSEAGYEFILPRPVSECTFALYGDSCGAFSIRGLLVDPYVKGITYSASGINGASVPSWLKCQLFEEELQFIPPDLVLFGIGINDANVQSFSPEQFKQNYRKLIGRIKRCNPNCAFLFITNNDCYLRVGKRRKTFNKNTAKVEQAFMELAEEYNGAVWNLYKVMGGYGSSSKWVRAGLMKSDHVHFSERGYNLLGDILFNAILTDYWECTRLPLTTE